MKKTLIFITALALTALTLVTSCQKDSPEYRILTGEKVRFSIGSAGAGTKAVYSGKGDDEDPTKMTIERIDWETGDMVRIYCEAASEPATRYADYVVTEDGIQNATHPEISETDIEAVGGAGLHWGEGEHIFYAVYPSPEEEGSITTGIKPYEPVELKSSVTKSISGATVTAYLTGSQAVYGGITGSTSKTAAPDLKNMLMTAKSDTYYPETGIPDGTVFLAFTPLTTAVQFTITNQTGGPLNLKSVSLISENSALSGPFTVNIAESAVPESIDLDGDGNKTGEHDIKYTHAYPTVFTYTGPVNDATKKVTIKFESGVTLAYDGSNIDNCGTLTFTFFLQPCQNFDDLTFKLVKSDDSWMSTRLGYTDGSGILFPRFMKTTVKGLFVPEGAQWTVKYDPKVYQWNQSNDGIDPMPEVSIDPFVTSWDTGIDDEIDLKSIADSEVDINGSTQIDYLGGTRTVSVSSNTSWTDGTVTPAPWYIEYWDSETSAWVRTKPSAFDWLSLSKESGIGGTDEELVFTVSGQTEQTESHEIDFDALHTNALKQAPVRTEPFDLSRWNPATSTTMPYRTTANSYVVNAAGNYKFPMVYGNALDENNPALTGGNNIVSYNPGASTTKQLGNFVNHAGRGIIDPWIKNNYLNTSTSDNTLIGTDNLTAVLLWQDAQGVISSVGVDGDYVTFSVNRDNICQCNALIALKQNGNVLWSWHIWVTDADLSDMATVTSNSVNYRFMPKNIGQCDKGKKSGTISYYPERSCRLRITNGVSEQEVVVRQPEFSNDVPQAVAIPSVYYQAGRKDPFIPSTGENNNDKDVYDIDGNQMTTFPETGTGTAQSYSTSDASLKNSILNPTVFYYISGSNGTWYGGSTFYCNLWSAAVTGYDAKSASTVKTVYDPCPVGFKVPNIDAFASFTTSKFTWSGSTYGRTLDGDPRLFFHADGNRNYGSGRITTDSQGSPVRVEGKYLSATFSSTRAYSLFFSGSGLNNSYTTGYLSVGRVVRPIAE